MSCFFLAFPKNAQKKITQEKSLRFLLRFLLRLFYKFSAVWQKKAALAACLFHDVPEIVLSPLLT
jgi:hypothetical protein